MKIKLRYTYFILCACMVMHGQTKETRADEFFKNFKFNKAIELYEDIADKGKRVDDHVLQNLADSYFNIGDYINAEKWYSKLYVQKGNEIGENNVIKLVQCLKANLKPERADEVLLDYYEDEDQLKMIMAQRQHLDSLLLTEARYEMDRLAFNSPKSDFSPAFYRDGSIVFPVPEIPLPLAVRFIRGTINLIWTCL